jgi:succinate dehydrogenase flavin-adding protein (antitoxin of CptAB toxin-antitoxin module)
MDFLSSILLLLQRLLYVCVWGINFASVSRGCRGRDLMVVGFTTTCAISDYYHWSSEFESHSWQSVLDTTCDQVCQWLVAGQWFSPVSYTNKTDCHDITEILLKEALVKYHKPPCFWLISATKYHIIT